jgi:hypothetical protein
MLWGGIIAVDHHILADVVFMISTGYCSARLDVKPEDRGIDDHISLQVVESVKGSGRSRGARELIDAVQAYLK